MTVPDGSGEREPERPPTCEHRAVLRFPFPDERRARVVHRAVAVEAGDIDDDRSGARATREGDTVAVTVDAADLVALRAGTNTWTRLVRAAEDAAGAAG